MTVEIMKEYIDYLSEYVTEPSLVVMDRLSSHSSKATLRYFESKRTVDKRQKFIPYLLRPKTSFLISPLDNSAIGDFKKKFYKYHRSTLELKELAATTPGTRSPTQRSAATSAIVVSLEKRM